MEEPIVKSVHKAIKILNCFKEKEEYSLTELSQKTGINKSTLYGLVQSLLINHFLYQSEKTRKYSLGIELFELGSLYRQRLNIRELASPYCNHLSEKFSATVNLTTYSNDEIIYIDKYESPDTVISITFIGKRLPMTVTAVGKAFLAFLGEDYFINNISNKPLPKLTKNSITSFSKLKDELKQARVDGYASDFGESFLGTVAFGAPIFDTNGVPVFGISAVLLSEQCSDKKNKELIQTLLKSAKDLSNMLEYD